MEFNLKLMTLLILTNINFKYLNTLFILIFIKKSQVIYVIITTFHSNANLNMNTIKGQFIMFYCTMFTPRCELWEKMGSVESGNKHVR